MNPYFVFAFGVFMVEILCPHCEGEIELDDDASGEFQCPLCDREFEWNVEEDELFDDTVVHTDKRIITTEFGELSGAYKLLDNLVLLIFVVGLLLLLLLFLIISMGTSNGSFFA